MNAPASPTHTTPQGAPAAHVAPPAAHPVKPLFRLIPWLLLGVSLLLVALVTTRWDHMQSDAAVQETDNATVRQDVAALDAKVGAYIRKVHFTDFQQVKKGDLLVELVDDDFRAAVSRAEAGVAKAAARLESLDSELLAQQAAVDQAVANAETSRSRLALAERENRRFSDLDGTGAVTGQEADSAKATYAAALATTRGADAAIEVQRRQKEVLAGERAQRAAELDSAKAALETARIDLSHTRIVAPDDGVVGARTVQPGSLLKPGTQVVSFVSSAPAYVIANYKETQLARVKPGQRVVIDVDGFPGAELKGRVTRVAPASGSTFAIVPADNATGNFTKVVQRIPVRIDLEAGQPLAQQLRAGMSVTTRIATESAQ
jgi:membrane fusion protein (multidrug efflux system)